MLHVQLLGMAEEMGAVVGNQFIEECLTLIRREGLGPALVAVDLGQQLLADKAHGIIGEGLLQRRASGA
ncbi:hypothetical protein [uncultured Desulfobulbus sp.]|uniref:hypothetical protein n=1 Tax=uncultured Desulfobulbus sp. TaxID=239745 RepID=UPI0029C99AF7|nr:hypothetical protein [uncultured Desulfobulbus sp.]